MRFCMVSTYYPPFHHGGDAIYLRELARQLVERGHQVDVVHCADSYLLHSPEPRLSNDEGGVVVHRLKSRLGSLSPLITQQFGLPGLKSRRLRALLDRDYDVLHFHNISLVGGPGVLGFGSARLRLYTPHDYWALCSAHVFWKDGDRSCDGPQCLGCDLRSRRPPQVWRFTRRLERHFETVDRILAPSRHCAQRYRLAALGPSVEYLPLFSAMSTPKSTKSGFEPYFLYAGRLEKPKGAHRLPGLFEGSGATLKVAGDGALLRSLRDRPSVEVLGPVPHGELMSTMAGAVAVVAPSLVPETFGLAVVEAFACGTPAIVSDRGALPELVSDSGAGIVCSSDSEFRAAIEQLSTDAALRESMGRRARDVYRERFTVERHMDRYLTYVEGWLKGRA